MTAVAIDTTQLRCRSKLHGIIKDYGNNKVLLEVRCKDKWCADRSAGVVVLHYFDLSTGELDHTNRFRDPKAKNGVLTAKGKRAQTNSSTPDGRSTQ